MNGKDEDEGPSWEDIPLRKLDLEKVTKDILEKWDKNPDKAFISVTPHRIKMKIGKKKRTEANWGFAYRFLIWVLLFFVLPASWGAEMTRMFPKYLGQFGAPLLISGFAVLLRFQLQSSFNSKVLKQLKQRATDRAVSPEALLMEAIVALWSLLNRPWFSGTKSYLVWWGDEDNNFDMAVTEPVREALVDLYNSNLDGKGTFSGWKERDYYDQKMSSAAGLAMDEFQGAWFKSVVLPCFIHYCVLGFSLSFWVWFAVVVPYVQPFLVNWGR